MPDPASLGFRYPVQTARYHDFRPVGEWCWRANNRNKRYIHCEMLVTAEPPLDQHGVSGAGDLTRQTPNGTVPS
ncbi:MAG: hypothetical protein U0787_02320 [Polyangia bacterium]